MKQELGQLMWEEAHEAAALHQVISETTGMDSASQCSKILVTSDITQIKHAADDTGEA